MLTAAHFLVGGTARSAVADSLAHLVTTDSEVLEGAAEGEVLRYVAALWDHGWQPAELVRLGRRVSPRVGRLAAIAVAADHSMRAPATLHPRWIAQIDAIELDDVRSTTGWLSSFAFAESLDGSDAVVHAVELLAALMAATPLQPLIPPPGPRDARRDEDLRPSDDVDDAVLAKIRALLAQAESTTFEAEAETFTGKAQELMSRHSIDDARAWARSDRNERPITIRLPIDDPYCDIKSLLLQVVAKHNRCRAVFDDRHALSSVVGFAGDVAAVETLFTSLLVQAQVAMQAEGALAGPGGRTRSRSFRSSFLMAYTGRIDHRLAAIDAAVESEEVSAVSADTSEDPSTTAGAPPAPLLPVLAERRSIVDEEVAASFGELRSNRVRGGDDYLGWERGALAADRAQLHRGDLTDAG